MKHPQTLSEASELVGRKVVYRAPHNQPDGPCEEGVITSVNDTYIFVRYGSDVGSKATRAEDLELISR